MIRLLTFFLFFFAFYGQFYAQNSSTYTVYFDSNSDLVSSENETILNGVLTTPNITKILIEGHTDDEGNEVYNRDLSERRADAVRRYLVHQGLAKDLISTSSFGENAPITENQTDDAKQLNRRVVVTVFFDIPQESPVIEPPQIEEVIAEEIPPSIPVPDSVSIDNSLLNSILARQLKPEFFKINNQRDTMIRTQSGILFYFNKGIFEGNCAEEITIKVTDYSSRRKAILANAPTLSNGRLLYSAGMFEIRAFCEDMPVDVKKGKKYNVFFPIKEDVPAVRKFKGFYGERDSLSGALNWEVVPSNPLPIVEGSKINCGRGSGGSGKKCFLLRILQDKRKRKQEERLKERIAAAQKRYPNINFDAIRGIPSSNTNYFAFQAQRMGFINCDAFWRVAPEKIINVLVDVPAKNNTQVWMVFEDRRSILQSSRTFTNRHEFARIPKNENVWIAATKIDKEGKLFLGMKRASTSDKRISLEFEEMESEEELMQILSGVNL